MSNQEIPVRDKMVDETGNVRTSWILYFQGLTDGDPGNKWTPIPTNLTQVGTPTITGNYYENAGYTDFWITIKPGTNTSATAGTTYFALPFDAKVDAPCFAVAGLTGGNTIGMVEAATNRCYPPAWTTVSVPLTISGRVLTK